MISPSNATIPSTWMKMVFTPDKTEVFIYAAYKKVIIAIIGTVKKSGIKKISITF